MMPKTDGEYQKLLTDVIKKQMVILGPDITLVKARNVAGLTVADDGTVTALSGNPQELIQQLIEQFVELSGLIVKKTMEPLLTSFPGLVLKDTSPQANQSSSASQQPPSSQTPSQEPNKEENKTNSTT